MILPRLTAILIGTTALLFAAPAPPPAVLKSFSLPDQFGTQHRIDFPRPRPLLLLIGDRRGSEEIDAWIAALKARWSESAEILGIADVSAAPRFVRQRVIDGIRKTRPKPLLLDFEGRITGSLPCVSKKANVFVIDTEGHVKAHVSGAYEAGSSSPSRLETLTKALEDARPNPRPD